MLHVCNVVLFCPIVLFVYVVVTVRLHYMSVFVIIFEELLIGGGAHSPGEFGVLEHPP